MADDSGGGGWLLLAVVIAVIAASAGGDIGSGSASSASTTSSPTAADTSSCDSTGVTTLSLGDEGSDVADLQECLRGLGYDDSLVDGIFGTRTRSAVTDFQRAEGLVADGIVGPDTRQALENAA